MHKIRRFGQIRSFNISFPRAVISMKALILYKYLLLCQVVRLNVSGSWTTKLHQLLTIMLVTMHLMRPLVKHRNLLFLMGNFILNNFIQLFKHVICTFLPIKRNHIFSEHTKPKNVPSHRTTAFFVTHSTSCLTLWHYYKFFVRL